MAIEKFQIVLNNPKKMYMSGDELKGQIHLFVTSPFKINKLTLQIKGQAKTKWEKESGNTTYIYLGRDVYFNNIWTIVEKPEDEDLEIEPGPYSFDFEFQLPHDIPPTYLGRKGEIKYSVSALLDRPWKFNKITTAVFAVKQVLDLNELALVNPNIKEPAFVQIEEEFCCCCNHGAITVMIKLPYSGFIQGQKVPLSISIENTSNVKVNDLRYKMSKIETFFTSNREHKKIKEEKILGGFMGIKVPKRSMEEFSYDLKIPNMPFVNLRNCDIIDIDYKLTFELVLSSSWTLTSPAEFELTFGTIQLHDFETVSLPLPPTYDESQKV